jgi:hypothetical protein
MNLFPFILVGTAGPGLPVQNAIQILPVMLSSLALNVMNIIKQAWIVSIMRKVIIPITVPSVYVVIREEMQNEK